MLMDASGCMVKKIPTSSVAHKSSEWFNYECKSLKRTVGKNLRNFRKYKQDRDKTLYISNRKRYKQMVHSKRQEFCRERITYINSNVNNPVNFWRDINKVCNKPRPKNNINIDEWHTHFKNLHNNIAVACPDILTIDHG